MIVSCRSIFALLLVPLLFVQMVSTTTMPAQAVSDIDDEKGFKTAFTVGRFVNSDPPRPDQIFKVYYRVINGTVERFNMPDAITAKVNSSGNEGILEIKFPRNYPYTNEINDVGVIDGEPILFVNNETINFKTQDITVTDCFFVFSIPFTGSGEIGLAWAYLLWQEPHHGDSISDKCAQQTVVGDAPAKKDGTISPLHQFRAGVAARDVVCPEQEEKQLMLMVSADGKPYCVKSDHEGILKARGWITPH